MTQAHGDWYNNPYRDQMQADVGGQPWELLDIVRVVGGRAAAPEHAAGLHRLEFRRVGPVIAMRLPPPVAVNRYVRRGVRGPRAGRSGRT